MNWVIYTIIPYTGWAYSNIVLEYHPVSTSIDDLYVYYAIQIIQHIDSLSNQIRDLFVHYTGWSFDNTIPKHDQIFVSITNSSIWKPFTDFVTQFSTSNSTIPGSLLYRYTGWSCNNLSIHITRITHFVCVQCASYWLNYSSDSFRFCSKLEQFKLAIPGDHRITQNAIGSTQSNWSKFQSTRRRRRRRRLVLHVGPRPFVWVVAIPGDRVARSRFEGLPIDSRWTIERARRQGRFHGSVPRGLEHRGGFNPSPLTLRLCLVTGVTGDP